MLSDEEELKKIKETQAAYSVISNFETLEMVPFDDEKLLSFHKYMKSLAQDLLGDEVDLDKDNLVFLLSDDKQPNAAYVDYPKAQGKKFIFISAALFDFIENKDQLGFILGHELQHFIEQKKHGEHKNTKAEESYSDLNAIPKLVRAGLNIEEAKHIADKMFNNEKILSHHLANEHLSDPNRKKLLDMWITAERQTITKQGKANDNVTGSKTHPLEDDIVSLIHSRPQQKGLRELFASEKYLNASYEERVDMWFAAFEDKLTLENNEKIGMIYADLSSVDKKILKEERIKLLEEMKPKRGDNYNYHFEEKFLECMLNEPSWELAYSKANVMEYSADYGDVELNLPPAKFGRYVQEKFGHLREITDEKEARLLLVNMRIMQSTVSRQAWRDLVNQRVLNLSHGKEDIGQTIPKVMLFGETRLDDFYPVKRVQDDIVLMDGNELFLIDKEGVINAVENNVKKIHERMIANQINETVQILNDIRSGQEVDDKLKVKTLTKAWLMSSPDVVDVYPDGTKALVVSDSSEMSKGLQIFGDETYLDMANIEPYLTAEAKAFWNERFEPEASRPYEHFLADTLVKGIKEEYTKDVLDNDIELMLEGLHREGIEKRPELTEKIAKAFLSREDAIFSESIVGKISAIKLKQHLEAGHSLDDFVFPFEKEYEAYFNRLKAEGDYKELFDYKTRTYYTYELLKKDPNIDLSQIIVEKNEWLTESAFALNEVSLSFDDMPDEFREQLRQRVQENIDNPKNWGDGTVAEGMTEAPFAERFYEICAGLQNPFVTFNQAEILQNVALSLYQQASVQDKLKYYAAAVGNTINRKVEEQELRKAKEQIWKVVGPDFENKDITLNDRLSLFLVATKNDLFDEAKIHYFETLVGKDGNGGLLQEIEHAPEPKLNLYLELLNNDNRIPDPEIRGRVISLAVKQFHKENSSYNDMTASPHDRANFTTHFEQTIKLMNETYNVSEIDRHQFLRELAEVTLAQKELCQVIKPNPPKINTQDKKLIAGAYGLDGLTMLMQNEVVRREDVINYLLSGGSQEDTQTALSMLRSSVINAGYRGSTLYVHDHIGEYLNMLTPQYLMMAKKEFDAAPLEVKGAIINLISESDNWEKHFDLVADKLFHDAGQLGNMGKKFLKAYVSSREGSERCFYLSAMYAAANNKTVTFDDGKSPYSREQRALAQGLRLFLENSGPAGVKLAQAMSSYADVPDFIRDEMQNAKNNANPPARWEVFDWLDNAHENDALTHGKIGKLLGSASFFVTYNMKDGNGQDKVIKIMRQGSKDLADAEFAVYKNMLNKMKDEFPGIESFKRLVDNAASMVMVETNLNIGEQQLRDAQKLYPDKANADGIDFKVNVMDWEARGKTWAAMEKAEGTDFKDLKQPYKKSVAKAVFTMELANMLSGERFDSDRHAGQYKFDTATNTIGVFDTGSVSVVEPTEKEKQVLGTVLANTVKTLMRGGENTPASVLCAEIDKGVTEFYQQEIKEGKSIPPYLSEFQRGLLALTDFHKEIPPQELGVCLMQALNNGKHKLDKNIYQGFKETILQGDGVPFNKESPEMKAAMTESLIYSVIEPENSSVMTKEAQLAQSCGKLMMAKVLEESNIYGVLTHLPPKMKSDDVLEALQTTEGQFHFAKGVAKELFAQMDPKKYGAEDKRQVGALLYKVVEQGARQKKLKQKVSLPKIFEEMAGKEPQLGKYAKGILTVARIAEKFDMTTDVEVFKKAVILGRLADNNVQNGYAAALRESPDSSFIKKALSYVSPLSFVPKKSARKLIKFTMKKIAPRCGEMIAQMTQNRVRSDENKRS